MELLITLILCHLIGDYVLQIDFIAKTKGSNWYHLFVHCALYCVPFLFALGFDRQIPLLFVSHMVIDALKARYNKIDYLQDQMWHYAWIVGMWCAITFMR